MALNLGLLPSEVHQISPRFLGFPEVSLGHVRVKTPPGLELAPFGHLSSGDILGPGISAWDESCWNGMGITGEWRFSVRFFFR